MTTGAEQGEIAEVGSPVLVPADPLDHDRSLRWATVTIATATLFLCLANAPTAVAWLDGLTPGPLTVRLRPATVAWQDATAGANAAHRWVAARWRAAHDWRFGDEQPGEAGATGP